MRVGREELRALGSESGEVPRTSNKKTNVRRKGRCMLQEKFRVRVCLLPNNSLFFHVFFSAFFLLFSGKGKGKKKKREEKKKKKGKKEGREARPGLSL